MDRKFFYIDYSTTNIEGKDFVCIYVLDYYNKQIFRIFKQKDNEIISKLNNYKLFNDITSHIDFIIKRNNKISLNIKI